MLGTLVVCLEELVKKEFGQTHWESILKRAGLPAEHQFYGHWIVDDHLFHNLFEACLTELRLNSQQLCNAFGKAWLHYTSVKYFAFFGTKNSAKEFILDIDHTHKKVAERINNATPPNFRYESINDHTLLMHYESKRNLVNLWLGILNAVGDYFEERIDISLIDKHTVKLVFRGKKAK